MHGKTSLIRHEGAIIRAATKHVSSRLIEGHLHHDFSIGRHRIRSPQRRPWRIRHRESKPSLPALCLALSSCSRPSPQSQPCRKMPACILRGLRQRGWRDAAFSHYDRGKQRKRLPGGFIRRLVRCDRRGLHRRIDRLENHGGDNGSSEVGHQINPYVSPARNAKKTDA